MHDLKIQNARICDGLGNPITLGTLAVTDGRISAVGPDVGTARHTIDAEGMVLAPGIVDVHTHYDAQITWDNTATPSPQNGVTTLIMGNCGFTIAPCRPADREITLRNLTKVEGIPYDALKRGVNWDFETFGEYLCAIEARGTVPNIACFAGHSSIRTWAMGDDARHRRANVQEIDRMRDLLGEALAEGAIGFSTSFSESHNGEGGLPVASRLADAAELEALAAVLRERNQGTLQITRSNTATIQSIGALQAIADRPLQMSAVMTVPKFPVMRGIRMTEHVGRPTVTDMRENTRSCLVSAPLRFLAWNMNYHAAHHYASSVPFHALPELQRMIEKDIEVEPGGYLGAHRDMIRKIKMCWKSNLAETNQNVKG